MRTRIGKHEVNIYFNPDFSNWDGRRLAFWAFGILGFLLTFAIVFWISFMIWGTTIGTSTAARYCNQTFEHYYNPQKQVCVNNSGN